MSTRHFSLTPPDAWFFRDGRPYNFGESNQADVESLFPPSARTATGALRAALARGNGWDGKGRWPDELNEKFGKSVNYLGALQFTGPFLIRGEELLWPVPRHLLGNGEGGGWKLKAFLRPGGTEVETDIGKVRLPEIHWVGGGERPEGLKPAKTAWIAVGAISKILEGTLPSADKIYQPSQLWRIESRVGLSRDEEKRTTGEGALYSPGYVRLCRGVSLGIGIEGIPTEMNPPPALFPFGGESRLAHCHPLTVATLLPKAPDATSFQRNADGRVEFIVVQLAPARFDGLESALPKAKVVSACVGKPVHIGGWDSLNRQPLPLEPFHPAGSVWFCTASEEDFNQHIHSLHGNRIGAYTAHGFGQILIGHWPR